MFVVREWCQFKIVSCGFFETAMSSKLNKFDLNVGPS